MLDVDVRDAVRPGQDLHDVAGRGRAIGADIGADIDRRAAAKAQNGPIAFAGDLQFAFRVACVIAGRQMFAAILDPLHRPRRVDAPGRE